MHRIDTSTAQADKFGAGKNGFTDGDKSNGRRATDLNADAFDAYQEEICGVIEGAGIKLDKNSHTQLLEALRKLFVGSDDERVTEALLQGNNLSDLDDVDKAKKNLSLDKVGNYKALPLTGGDLTGIVNTSEEIRSSHDNNFRMVNGDRGTFWRQDGANLYLMKTESGDQYGTYDGSRPIRVDLANGTVYLNDAQPYSQNNCPFPVGYVMLMGNGTNPSDLYPNTTWRDLTDEYDGRNLQLGRSIFVTGGSNSVTLQAQHMPPHRHNGGSTGDAGITPDGGAVAWGTGRFGTDNKGAYSLMQTSAAGDGQAFSVQNEYVHVLGWMRIA